MLFYKKCIQSPFLLWPWLGKIIGQKSRTFVSDAFNMFFHSVLSESFEHPVGHTIGYNKCLLIQDCKWQIKFRATLVKCGCPKALSWRLCSLLLSVGRVPQATISDDVCMDGSWKRGTWLLLIITQLHVFPSLWTFKNQLESWAWVRNKAMKFPL